jgi:holo-[acyl-carrier protein] synthase
MNVMGIGTEIVECARIGRLIQKHDEEFLRSAYTRREIAYCNRQTQAIQHFAARWVAKAAVLKAIGISQVESARWCDIEICGSIRGPLTVRFAGPLRRQLANRSIGNVLITAAYSRGVAMATALILSRS